MYIICMGVLCGWVITLPFEPAFFPFTSSSVKPHLPQVNPSKRHCLYVTDIILPYLDKKWILHQKPKLWPKFIFNLMHFFFLFVGSKMWQENRQWIVSILQNQALGGGVPRRFNLSKVRLVFSRVDTIFYNDVKLCIGGRRLP